MKRALQLMLALSIISLFLISPVAAATSQGLEWGIESGDQWNFDFTVKEVNEDDFIEVMYFESTGGLTTIPNILTDWVSIPDPTFDITWENGSSIGFYGLIFIFYFIVSDTFVVPIGNYTLLGELYEDSLYNGTIYNSASYWGMQLNDFEFSGNTLDIHV
ncbi:hypothetical protein EU527_18690, partial [Candidatus Thorarchaeota archaeon]